MLGLLITECNQDQILVLFIHSNLTLSCVLNGALRFSKTISNIIFVIITIFLLSIAVTPSAHILCFCVFQVFFHSYVNKVSLWLPIFLVMLSNDVDFNPGPHFQNNLFNFMTWNANSLAKDNFERVRLIQAHNSIFNYDIISICETSLNDSVELPETLLNDFTFVPANNPSNTRHGGVGLFFKNCLPVVIRDDLSFDESIVVELKFGRKKYSLQFYIEALHSTIPRLNSKPFW